LEKFSVFSAHVAGQTLDLKAYKKDINDSAPRSDPIDSHLRRVGVVSAPAPSIEPQLIHMVIRLYDEWLFKNLKMRHFVEGLLLSGFETIKCNRERN
jgi:hypothetical protein